MGQRDSQREKVNLHSILAVAFEVNKSKKLPYRLSQTIGQFHFSSLNFRSRYGSISRTVAMLNSSSKEIPS